MKFTRIDEFYQNRKIVPLKISNSTPDDIDTIFKLYRLAADFQESKFLENIWPKFERSLVETEINESRQFKITINGEIACVWAITFDDPAIWEEKNVDPSVYIHRIATNPKYRGQNFVQYIVDWARVYASKHYKQFIRLDTCGNNLSLIKHYTGNGFSFLGIHKLKDSKGLPSHYIGADVCFFEIKLD